MAKHTIIKLIDDLEGGDADETVTFALDGNQYEIDLSDSNAAQLREVLTKYVVKGRRIQGSLLRRSTPAPKTPSTEPVVPTQRQSSTSSKSTTRSPAKKSAARSRR